MAKLSRQASITAPDPMPESGHEELNFVSLRPRSLVIEDFLSHFEQSGAGEFLLKLDLAST